MCQRLPHPDHEHIANNVRLQDKTPIYYAIMAMGGILLKILMYDRPAQEYNTKCRGNSIVRNSHDQD